MIPTLIVETEVPDEVVEVVDEGCKCGLAVRSDRIVGGQETEVNEYPWQIGITSPGSNSILCGGAVVSSVWILSAAHCFVGTSPNDVEVNQITSASWGRFQKNYIK